MPPTSEPMEPILFQSISAFLSPLTEKVTPLLTLSQGDNLDLDSQN